MRACASEQVNERICEAGFIVRPARNYAYPGAGDFLTGEEVGGASRGCLIDAGSSLISPPDNCSWIKVIDKYRN